MLDADDRPVGEPLLAAGEVTEQDLEGKLHFLYSSGDITMAPSVHHYAHCQPVCLTSLPDVTRAEYAHEPGLALWLGPEHWGGQERADLAKVPVYATAKVVLQRGSPQALEINYMTLYVSLCTACE
jgi:hypothetical protein